MSEPEENENAFTDQDASRESSYYFRGKRPPKNSDPTPYIDPNQLQTLAEGHFGITNMLFGSFVVGAFLSFSMVWVQAFTFSLAMWGALLIPTSLIIAILYPTTKRIGIGLDWDPRSALPVAIILGLNVILCGGFLGFAVVQGTTSNALRKYGLKVHSLGIRRQDVAEKVEEMRRRKLAAQPQINNPK